MNPSPARLNSSLLIGIGICLLGAGLWAGLQLRYKATARIKIVGEYWQTEPAWTGKGIPEPIQVGIVGVYSLLGTVVESPTFAGDRRNLQPAEAIARLRRSLDIHPIRNTSLVETQFASRNPEEAANIVNRIAQVSANLPQVQIVDLATPPTQRVFPNLADGLKLVAFGIFLTLLGLFVLFDTRQSSAIAAGPRGDL